ncbi:hypothetical protein Fmac_027361 [Flemingia macrophylla]|uniref:F-box domain-containing protein n=1 Tax=Flemingia macrophylla TaxID=520843 RepID=A0ABD1LHM5_9FABA
MSKIEDSGVDRISKLPDEIVCHILSFLPSNESTATCLLSSRWRFLWRMVPSLHFDCNTSETYDHVDNFLSLRATPIITRFHLNCKNPCFCIPYIQKWVSKAIHGKVEQLNMFLCETYHQGFMFIPTLFTCTTLVTLNLNFSDSVYLHVPPSVHLPSLKTLQLDSCLSLYDFKKFFYGSPSLELAHFKQSPRCGFLPELVLKIVRSPRGIIQLSHANEICAIVIECDDGYDFIRDYLEGDFEKYVKVKASIVVHDTNSKFKSKFRFKYVHEYVFVTLKRLRNVELLSFSDFSSWTKYADYDEEFTLDDLPIFQNLVKLQLDIKDYDSIYWTLPTRCPKLRAAARDNRSDVNKDMKISC